MLGVTRFTPFNEYYIKRVLWGSDGRVWCQNQGYSTTDIGALDPTNGNFSVLYSLGSGTYQFVADLAGDGAGNWWAGDNISYPEFTILAANNSGSFSQVYFGGLSSNYVSQFAYVAPHYVVMYKNVGHLGVFDTVANAMTYYPTPTNVNATMMTTGPDNCAWFTDFTSGTLNKIDPVTGTITNIPITGYVQALASDGTNMWVLNQNQCDVYSTSGALLHSYLIGHSVGGDIVSPVLSMGQGGKMYLLASPASAGSQIAGGPLLVSITLAGVATTLSTALYGTGSTTTFTAQSMTQNPANGSLYVGGSESTTGVIAPTAVILEINPAVGQIVTII